MIQSYDSGLSFQIVSMSSLQGFKAPSEFCAMPVDDAIQGWG